ncbi:MAG: cupin domain-containing protein, partial [Rhodospirillaceae bacterium]
ALDATFPATGSIWYVIQGSGTAAIAGETIEWAACDVFILPGGDTVALTAGDADAVLWSVTNEPHIAFESTRPVEVDDSTVDIVHFPAAEIDRQIGMLYEVEQSDAAGIALVFSSEKQFARRNITPTMTLAMNTLPPGDTQPAHRHNSVAVTLVVQGEGCYSTVDGRRKPWAPWVTTITPPVSVHSHTNGGDKLAKFLIVQDGGLYYHARTMGFSFDLFTPEA